MGKEDSKSSTISNLSQSRRRFLASLIASAGVLPFSGKADAISNAVNSESGASSHEELEGNQSDIPPYPDDPFIQPSFGVQYIMGWENYGYPNESTENIQQNVLDLHPDVLAFDHLLQYEDGQLESSRQYQEQFGLAQALGLPATSGMNPHIDIEEASSRYGAIAEESEWEFPDGTPVSSPTDIIAETFDGERHKTDFTFETLGTPSVFAPGGLELMTNAGIEQLNQGYSGFFIDGVNVFRLHGLDFSRWAQDAFRTHLESLSEDRLAALEIDTPQSFDIREYLRQNNLSPNQQADPREDPVFKEYLLHQHQGIDKWFQDYREIIEQQFPNRMENDEIALYANQFTGNFQNPQAANVYISDSMDAIYTELFPRVDPPVDVNYKIMRSVGNFSKPVIAKGTLAPINQDELNEFKKASSNTMLKRFQVAEAYSTGARFQLPLTARQGYSEEESVTNWISGDGSVPDELRSFINFLWAHERFLSDIEPSGDIALIWSLPTRIWRHEETWNIGSYGDTPKFDSFTGTASILREAGFTYDVLTFGHPRLWDDTIQLNRLSEYSIVILAGVESISDEQISALNTYIDDGGMVLCTDTIPDRDTMYEPRDDVAAIFDRENATIVDGHPGRQRERNSETNNALLDAIKNSGVKPTRQTDDSDIAVHSHKQSDPDRYIIPLVNYAYDPETDSFSTKFDINIRLPAVDSTDPVARYYSPQGITDLELLTDNDSHHVVVPELLDWGFIVLASTTEEFESSVSKESALNTIEAAEELLEKENEMDQGSTADIRKAKTKLQAAESAISFDAFGQAETAASEAIEAVTPPETEEVENDQGTTDDEAPGFGIGGALVGIGGMAYLLKNHLIDTGNEST